MHNKLHAGGGAGTEDFAQKAPHAPFVGEKATTPAVTAALEAKYGLGYKYFMYCTID